MHDDVICVLLRMGCDLCALLRIGVNLSARAMSVSTVANEQWCAFWQPDDCPCCVADVALAPAFGYCSVLCHRPDVFMVVPYDTRLLSCLQLQDYRQSSNTYQYWQLAPAGIRCFNRCRLQTSAACRADPSQMQASALSCIRFKADPFLDVS